MSSSDLNYTLVRPPQQLSAFVDSYWMLHNPSAKELPVVILPDGRIDLFFSVSDREAYHVALIGIGTHPEQAVIAPGTRTFAISFRLPAVEYILHESVSELLNEVRQMPDDYFGFGAGDLDDFGRFCQKASATIAARLPEDMDNRKRRLFDHIYASQGSAGVQELAGEAAWSSRQINRYFTQQFGLPLKAYCGILRFRASFEQIREGKLFPEGHFSDQSHFIKEIKKLSGVLPKELKRNQDDRFIQFSTLPRK